MKKILGIYGCGGLGREALYIAKELDVWRKIIFIDDNPKSSKVNDVEVYTFDYVLDTFNISDLRVVIALGEPSIRRIVFEKVTKQMVKLENLFYKDFRSPSFSSLGAGNVIHFGTLMVTNIILGNNCFINKSCVIGHDVTIGDDVVISPSATIGGDTIVGDRVYIGSGAVVRDHISIGNNAIIGMGAVVTKEVPENAVVVGNPAKIIRYNSKKKVF